MFCYTSILADVFLKRCLLFLSQVPTSVVTYPFKKLPRGAWVAQLFKHLPCAQVMIPEGWGGVPPTSGSLLSGESASPSPSAAPPAYGLSLRVK